jgi:hypothetical protein
MMNRINFARCCLIITASCMCWQHGFSYTAAQKPKPQTANTSPGRKPPAKASSEKENDPEIARRRSIAQGSLNTLAIEARSYRDEALRVRVQARVADALWDQEQENARNLFRRAWEAAEVFETKSDLAGPSGPGRFGRTSASGRPRTNLRAEILRLAASRDHLLGEEFLKKLAETRKEAATSGAEATASPAEMRERLRLADEFLEKKDVTRALLFADPALVQLSSPIIGFLIALRAQQPNLADQRFGSLLNRAALDPGSDANTVSLLIRYAFTPWIDLVVSPEGIPSSNSYLPGSGQPDLPPALRSAVLRISADILLRPFAQLDQSSAGRAGTYFIATRLLPIFQQHAPDLAPAINAQLRALGPDAARATQNAGDRLLNHGLTAETAGFNVADDLQERLDRARTSDERDRAYAFAAMGAADGGDPNALEFVNKIADLATQKGIKTFVEYRLIEGYLKDKKVDEAVRLARKSEISHALRAHTLTKAGELTAKTDVVRARELLEEALTEARRTDASSPERAYTLIGLLVQFAKLDPVRAWEIVDETIKAGNAAPNFTGENGNTRWTLEGKFSIAMGTQLAGPTDLAESFENLARDNFYQAMDVGRNFSGDAPRALVTIAIAKAALDATNKPR